MKVILVRLKDSKVFGQMAVKILNVKDTNLYSDNIKKAAQALRDGNIIAFPTETVYGLGVDAQNSNAIGSLYNAKQRPINKKLAILIADSDDVLKYTDDISPVAGLLMKTFWPGPLTIVFTLPNNETVGIRNSSNRIVRDIIKCAGVEIASTSANVSGKQPATNAQQVVDNFNENIDVVLDGGQTQSTTPSTVIKIVNDNYEIIRHGIIDEERINRCLNEDSISIRP